MTGADDGVRRRAKNVSTYMVRTMACPILNAPCLAGRRHPASRSLRLIQECLRPALRGEPRSIIFPTVSATLFVLAVISVSSISFTSPRTSGSLYGSINTPPLVVSVPLKGPPHVPRPVLGLLLARLGLRPLPCLSLSRRPVQPTHAQSCAGPPGVPPSSGTHTALHTNQTSHGLTAQRCSPTAVPRPHEPRRPVISRLPRAGPNAHPTRTGEPG
jgi:hypothetical protein